MNIQGALNMSRCGDVLESLLRGQEIPGRAGFLPLLFKQSNAARRIGSSFSRQFQKTCFLAMEFEEGTVITTGDLQRSCCARCSKSGAGSDKFGHGNCVILRGTVIQKILRVVLNALIAATFRRNCART
jgi:hypothetical protein